MTELILELYPYLRRIITKMTDTSIYRSTLRRRSVSESDTDPLNSTVNPWGNPSQYIPPDQTKSDPNISVSIYWPWYTPTVARGGNEDKD